MVTRFFFIKQNFFFREIKCFKKAYDLAKTKDSDLRTLFSLKLAMARTLGETGPKSVIWPKSCMCEEFSKGQGGKKGFQAHDFCTI